MTESEKAISRILDALDICSTDNNNRLMQLNDVLAQNVNQDTLKDVKPLLTKDLIEFMRKTGAFKDPNGKYNPQQTASFFTNWLEYDFNEKQMLSLQQMTYYYLKPYVNKWKTRMMKLVALL